MIHDVTQASIMTLSGRPRIQQIDMLHTTKQNSKKSHLDWAQSFSDNLADDE